MFKDIISYAVLSIALASAGAVNAGALDDSLNASPALIASTYVLVAGKLDEYMTYCRQNIPSVTELMTMGDQWYAIGTAKAMAAYAAVTNATSALNSTQSKN